MNKIIWQPNNNKEAEEIIQDILSSRDARNLNTVKCLLKDARNNRVDFSNVLLSYENEIYQHFAEIISESDGLVFHPDKLWDPKTKEEAEEIIKNITKKPNAEFISILYLARQKKLPFHEIIIQNEEKIINSLEKFANDNTISYKFTPSKYDFYFLSKKYEPQTEEEAKEQAKEMLKDFNLSYFSIINHAKKGEAVFSEILIKYTREIEQNNLKHFLNEYREKYNL